MSGLFSHIMERTVLVEATPWTLWKVLTDLSEYGTWNALYPEAAGTVRTGEDITASMRLVSDKPMRTTLRVAVVEHSKELAWTASYAFPGFLDMTHCFIIAPVDRYGSRLTHGIRVSGILTPLYAKALRNVAEPNLDRMTATLKARAEARR
ncbi:SRPBCC domain-containing protein [Desulfovibrio mangrovi]|uniref:SRPBCC domain-containing protein n=1 Tax=Desulfovibrio mangrovi TaxID=2976983 RepID=UPI0022468582|nr:SRPBCC domain-containing protein [Desulfovibrio mangrovi]UZP66869.1 SRPBCC domain-containing protein [Desulfovibrio mangrovi]